MGSRTCNQNIKKKFSNLYKKIDIIKIEFERIK